MLITFSCQAYANVTFFGEVGQQLLKVMGYNKAASGAIPADSVPAVLERLNQELIKEKVTTSTTGSQTNADTAFSDESISLAKRALPLIELLKAAATDKCNVWWETKP